MFLLFFNLNCLQIYLEEKISICFKWALAKITIIWLKPNIKLILKDGLKPFPIQICNKTENFIFHFFNCLQIYLEEKYQSFLLFTPADSKLAISFKKATADCTKGKAKAQPVPSPKRN